ncbi:MAG: IS21 family transposase [Magnetococcales bacterium]|nr:IS21 family transposase [Magnetococcales bacterium]
MAGKEIDVFEARELIRRLKMRQSGRSIATDLQISRDTVRRYKELAEQNEWLSTDELPSVQEIEKSKEAIKEKQLVAHEQSSVLPFESQVKKLLEAPKMTVTVIHQRLQERGFKGSYSSVIRFVRNYRAQQDPEGFCRMEVAPGEEAQVDFGYIGMIYDPVQCKERKAWVFVMTLSHSRHFYAEIVFDQSSGTWLRLHQNAFMAFAGIPAKIVLDNLKAAIIKAAIYDPLVQRSYRNLAEHYGFMIAPNRPHTPRHKGKVERTIRYLKQNFLPGRSFRDIADANEQLCKWNDEIASLRIHGTTGWRPLERFEEVEQEALLSLPDGLWSPSVWKKAKLHPDCHVQIDKSFYSAPFRLIGKKLTVQIVGCQVRIFNGLELEATHQKALSPRTRQTNPDHLPPDKVQLLMATPFGCLQRAENIGPSTLQWMHRLLGNRVTDRLRSGLAALRLADKYSSKRLEAACQRSLDFDDISYGTLKRILVKELDQQPWKHLLPPSPSEPIKPSKYARQPDYYFPDSKEIH